MAMVARKEAKTGKEMPGTAGGLSLAAVGSRTITFAFLKVHPYACAVYCDAAGARGMKGANKEATATAFIEAKDVKKGLLLEFTRTVTGKDAGQAMLERLKRVTDKPNLNKFIGSFQNAHFKDGSTMFFVFEGNTVTIDIAGVKAEPVESAELCCAMLENYVGSKDPVDPQLADQLHEFVCAAAAEATRGG